eukprot:4703564-Pleurochrysis_carterae.AAC.2
MSRRAVEFETACTSPRRIDDGHGIERMAIATTSMQRSTKIAWRSTFMLVRTNVQELLTLMEGAVAVGVSAAAQQSARAMYVARCRCDACALVAERVVPALDDVRRG